MMTALRIAAWVLVPEVMIAAAFVRCALDWAEVLGFLPADECEDEMETC